MNFDRMTDPIAIHLTRRIASGRGSTFADGMGS